MTGLTPDERRDLAERHTPDGFRTIECCARCGDEWPCRTTRALAMLGETERREQALRAEIEEIVNAYDAQGAQGDAAMAMESIKDAFGWVKPTDGPTQKEGE